MTAFPSRAQSTEFTKGGVILKGLNIYVKVTSQGFFLPEEDVRNNSAT